MYNESERVFLSLKHPVKLSFVEIEDLLKLLFPMTPLKTKFLGSLSPSMNKP